MHRIVFMLRHRSDEGHAVDEAQREGSTAAAREEAILLRAQHGHVVGAER